MHRYRSHTCNELRAEHVGEVARLSGWVHRVRDHGHLVFVDLRDHYGVTQCFVEADHEMLEAAQNLRAETVLTVLGAIVRRDAETIN